MALQLHLRPAGGAEFQVELEESASILEVAWREWDLVWQ